MSVEITHNGYPCGLSDMSGGEQSRLVLAYQLALSSLYKSPILLLDEPFKGLDVDAQDACLDALKHYSLDKLVIIADHVTQTSIYDSVIHI